MIRGGTKEKIKKEPTTSNLRVNLILNIFINIRINIFIIYNHIVFTFSIYLLF
jgi:hypothetical protein